MKRLLLLPLLLAGPAAAQESYDDVVIEGWSLKLNRKITGKRESLARAMLTQKLKDIRRVLPRYALERVQAIPIWVEEKNQDLRGLRFNPSARWLREHGQNPRKANGVEVCNLDDLFNWKDQPWMVLHELAHAYQFNVLGDNNRQVLDAFHNAQQKGLYQKVKRGHGPGLPYTVERAYALTNEREYFAELSEAYFGVNDFYPFNRRELAAYDPVGYAMIEKCWFDLGDSYVK